MQSSGQPGRIQPVPALGTDETLAAVAQMLDRHPRGTVPGVGQGSQALAGV